MTRDEFDALIKRLEEFAARKPKTYNLRVGLLAALGYGYLFAVLVLLIFGSALLGLMMIRFPNGLTIKIGIVWGVLMVTLGFNILRAMWIRMENPQGLELHRKDFPDLFGMVDGLSQKLNAPFFHRILLVPEYNAAVVQIPRLGIFGWYRNFLLVGLPLMEGLSPEQFKAVVAHEMGHLSGNHSRFAGWIYRVRHTWDRLLHHLIHSENGSGAGLFIKFIQWYSPYFNAYSFVLARSNEYDADRCAVELTSRQHAAEALINVQVHNRLLGESFWPDIFKRVNSQAEPPRQAFVQMASTLQRGAAAEDVAKWLKQSWLVQTNNADTHPCLRDRLGAMGFPTDPQSPPLLPSPHSATAAAAYLGGRLDDCRQRLETAWQQNVEKAWRERHAEAQVEAKKLETLAASTENLTVEKQWEQIALVQQLKGDEEALPLIQALLAREPDHAGANFQRGRILLDHDDETGIAFLEASAKKQPVITTHVCELLYGYYQRTGQHSKLRELENRAEQHQERLNLARVERNNLAPTDRFKEHALPPEKIAALVETMKKDPDVRSACIVQKVLQHFPESPLYLIAVWPDAAWYSLRSSDANQKLIERLVKNLPMPGETLVFAAADNLAAIGEKVKQIPDAEFYFKDL